MDKGNLPREPTVPFETLPSGKYMYRILYMYLTIFTC